MNQVKGFGQLGDLLDKQCSTFARDLVAVDVAGTREVTALLTTVVATNLGGRRIVLHGVGKKGGPVGVVGTIVGKNGIVRMTGKAAPLIERDTKAHDISRKAKGKATRAAAFGPLVMPGTDTGFRSGVVHHPGTKGKHPFRDGVATVRPIAPKVYQRGTNRALRKAFT